MKRFILLLSSLSLIVWLIVLSACSGALSNSNPGPVAAADGNYTVRIGFPALVKDAPAPEGPDLWALEQGFFDREFGKDGIKVEYRSFLGAAPAINEAMAAGSLDMAVIADIGALIGKAAGIKTSLVAMGNPEGIPWWLLVSGSSSINGVADLKGKKVATIKGTLPHFYLLEALKANGLQASDINLINMTGPDSEQALRLGQIDAMVSGTWKSQQLLKEGFRAIDSTRETPIGRGTLVIVATDGFIAAHPTFFPRFFQVRQQASDWANANHDTAIDLIAMAAGGIDRTLIEPLWPAPFNFDQSLTGDVLERVKAGEKFLRDLALTRNAVDVEGWINQIVAYQKP